MLKKECYAFQMMLSFIDVLLTYVCLPSEGFLRYTIHCVILKSQHEVKIFPIYFLNIHFRSYCARISAYYSNQIFQPLKRFYFLITSQIPYFQTLPSNHLTSFWYVTANQSNSTHSLHFFSH